MKKQCRIFATLITFSLLPINGQTAADEVRGVSFFSPRSQSENAARELAGWHPYINQYGKNSCYAVGAITPGYYQSVRAKRIADVLFAQDVLHISGSQVNNRNENDILADYFGLSPEFVSTVYLEPKIQNGIVDLAGYIGLDGFCKGLYIRAHAPIVWTKWGLNLTENVFDDGSNAPFPAGYMATNEIPAPIGSFVDALKGGITFGQMHTPLTFGKVNKSQTKWGLSDLQCALGWNFLLREHGFVGLSIRAAAPTGTRAKGLYLFEPIVGNGKHWELGGGFSGSVLIWESGGDQKLSFFTDVNITHLFASKQKRSFDFDAIDDCPTKLSRFGSRYILLKEFDSASNYIGELIPAINVTTLDCDVTISAQFDIVFMFGYTNKGFTFDLGYNAWFRTKESIKILGCIPENTYGLKGIQDVVENINTLSIVTQSNATLFGNEFSEQNIVSDDPSPVFIQTSDLQPRSAAHPFSLTHKIFAYFGYGWENVTHIPFIGVGGEIEFEGINERDTIQANQNTLSQ